MSLESWKAEFYPVNAVDATNSDTEALEHSIVKWSGLLEESLERHGGRKHEYHLKRIEFGDSGFVVDSSSCALCRANFRAGSCKRCPIYRASGRDCETEFSHFTHGNDAHPMLDLLKRTKEWMEGRQ